MKKIIADPLLMITAILIIVCFQVYWLKNNYDREKRLLSSKAGIIFRTTMFELQAKKLKLNLKGDSGKLHTNFKVIFKGPGEEEPVFEKSAPAEQIVGITNAARNQLMDTTERVIGPRQRMMVSVDRSASYLYQRDSAKGEIVTENIAGNDKIFQVLYGIDSLQDSLKINDIVAATKKSFNEEKLTLPFSVSRNDTSKSTDHFFPGVLGDSPENMNQVTVGFAHPTTYQLELGNDFSYLLRKILSPLLFSVFLVGVTIFSFLLLYRNLLRQRRLTDIKNEFIANITHELKTPISTVSVAIEAMKNFDALQNPERTKEYLDIADGEVKRLGLLVDKVLKLTMFEKKQTELNKEDFDLKVLIQEVIDSLKLQFEKNKATVTFNAKGDNFIINADRLHITSVIYNLLDNALKYTSAEPVVEVQLSKEKNIFELRVRDNGIGIPTEYQKKIFDKFFRVPAGNEHAVKGYGLGLSYVSEIIQRHMGYIFVESKLGKGSTFIAKIPDHEADIIWFDDKRSIRREPFSISAKKKL